jgi:hypothetical protein
MSLNLVMGNICILVEICPAGLKSLQQSQDDYNGATREMNERDLYGPCPSGGAWSCTVRQIAMQRLVALHTCHNPTRLSLIVVLIVQNYILQNVRERDHTSQTVLVINDHQPVDPRLSNCVEDRIKPILFTASVDSCEILGSL